MHALAVKPKLASGPSDLEAPLRVIEISSLAADVLKESRAANDQLAMGSYYDGESGLIYNGANYYDPKTGRWVSPDGMSIEEHVERWRARMGMPGQPSFEGNPYARVLNNPLRWIDRTGFEAESANADYGANFPDPEVPEPGLGGVYPEALLPIGKAMQGAARAAKACGEFVSRNSDKIGELCRTGARYAILLGALCSPGKDGEFKPTRSPVRDMTRVEQIKRQSSITQKQNSGGPPK